MTIKVFIMAGNDPEVEPFYVEIVARLGYIAKPAANLGFIEANHQQQTWHYDAEIIQEILAWQPDIIVFDITRYWSKTPQRAYCFQFIQAVRQQAYPHLPPHFVVIFRGAISKEESQVADRLLTAPVGSELGRAVKELVAMRDKLLQDKADPQLRKVATSPLSARLQQEEATATRHLLAHLAHAPQDGLGWSMLGDLYWGLGNFKAAEQAYTTAIGCPPTTEPYRPYYSRGLLRQSLGQYGLALGDFLQADKQVTGHSSLKWSLAENFKLLGFYHQAQSIYEQIDEDLIDESDILCQQIDQVKGCLEHPTLLGLGWGGVQSLEKEVPPPIMEILSTAIPSTFESLEAIRPLLRLVEQFPDNPMVWRYLGHAYWYGGHEVEAEAAFAEIVKREPVSAVSHFIQGCLAYIKQDYETTLGLFQQAEQGELTPADRLQLYSYRSRLYDRLGQSELAQQERQRYDQLSGVAFHASQHEKHRHKYFEGQVPLEKPITFNEQGLRPAKILLLGEKSGWRPYIEKCCSSAGYIVRDWGIAEYTPPSLKYDPMIAQQILAWQPDVILCEMLVVEPNNPYYAFLISLMYQIRQRSPGQLTYPRHLLYTSDKLLPDFLSDLVTPIIDHCYTKTHLIIRELFQTVERVIHQVVSPNLELLKRDWSSPPHELILDTHLYKFYQHFNEPTHHFILILVNSVGSRGYGTAILTDGRHVRIWLAKPIISMGAGDRPGTPKDNSFTFYHGEFIDLAEPEQVVILSVIGPLKP